MQRRERMIGIDLAQVGHPLFFDEMTLARQALQNARDDLRQQGLQLYGGGCTRLMEHRGALAAAIHAVVPVKGTMSTRQCRWMLRLAAEPKRCQKAGNDAVDDLQYRREQLRVSEQDAQRDRK